MKKRFRTREARGAGHTSETEIRYCKHEKHIEAQKAWLYQHYGYMTGEYGQRVRVYCSLDGNSKVSITWARNGMLVGRDYYTDQGKIEKYL